VRAEGISRDGAVTPPAWVDGRNDGYSSRAALASAGAAPRDPLHVSPELLYVLAKRYRVRFVRGRLRKPLVRELCEHCAIVPLKKCGACWYVVRARVFLSPTLTAFRDRLRVYEQGSRFE